MQGKLTFPASDGVELTGTLFLPAAGDASGGVLIAGAMATPQTHYAAFARWLADQGVAVLTFDYRGTHASGGERVARTDASFDTWGQLDVSAAARALQAQVPGLPMQYLGHSLGGQLFASCTEQARFGRAVLVASGSGYWPKLRNAVPRWGLFLTTQVWGPLLTPLFGYFPGKRLRKVGDLPAGVIRQWAHWCRHPDYLARDAEQRDRFTRVVTPITYLHASDDEVFSDWSCDRFLALFSAGTVRRRLQVHPQQLGVARIGHFGYFRARLQASLWPQLQRELLA
jgi:predicted alpha/beta hydrolase